MATNVALKSFFHHDHFAVVGASTNRAKFGNKCLRWYKEQGQLPVTPINPSEREIEGIAALKTLEDLPNPTATAISVITPPRVTLEVLRTAKERGVPALWLQPGAEDAEVTAYIKDNDLTDRTIFGGPCILVLGSGLLAEAKKPKPSL